VLVQSKRNKHATLKLMRKLLKKYGFVPDRMITDDLRSYSAARATLGSKLATSAIDGSCPPTPSSTTLSTLSVI
jgi:transposase-like protein